MKQLSLGSGIIKMEEVPEPKVKPNEVKVKIAFAGLCGTDPENLEHRFGLMPPEAYKGARILGMKPRNDSRHRQRREK